MANVDEWRHTACILCECNCGLEVQLGGEGGRHFEKIRGDRAHPSSQGYACEKAHRIDHYQNGPDRVTAPQVTSTFTPFATGFPASVMPPAIFPAKLQLASPRISSRIMLKRFIIRTLRSLMLYRLDVMESSLLGNFEIGRFLHFKS